MRVRVLLAAAVFGGCSTGKIQAPAGDAEPRPTGVVAVAEGGGRIFSVNYDTIRVEGSGIRVGTVVESPTQNNRAAWVTHWRPVLERFSLPRPLRVADRIERSTLFDCATMASGPRDETFYTAEGEEIWSQRGLDTIATFRFTVEPESLIVQAVCAVRLQ